MRKLLRLARRASQLGPRVTAERAIAHARRQAAHTRTRLRDQFAATFETAEARRGPLVRYCHFVPAMREWDWPQRRTITEHYLAHRFDLLGSGWVPVRHGMQCRGVEGHCYDSGPGISADAAGGWLQGRINRANLATAQSIWQAIGGDYQPIDWHLDFKSGYRWQEDQWHGGVPYAHRPGVDIKVPWELSRMQHLPQMAVAAEAASRLDEDLAWTERVRQEFRNQVLDFIACNPPRYGVNWRCAMDVSIRAANWLVAYDLFRAGGMPADETFDGIFAQSIAAHGAYLVENLEWQRLHRGNHYLADITGLLFIAAYLPCSDEVNAWLAFAVQELISEIPRQFTPDGANFEASTSYHRLSAEMAIFGAALILALGDEKQTALADYDHRRIRTQPYLRPAPTALHPLPGGEGLSALAPECWERLQKMGHFSRDVTKPTGAVHQVGDNDNGRFLKLWPTYQRRPAVAAQPHCSHLTLTDEYAAEPMVWEEDHLDHRGMIAAASALVGSDELENFCHGTWPEIDLVNQWAGTRGRVERTSRPGQKHHVESQPSANAGFPAAVTASTEHSQVCRIALPQGVARNLTAIAYSEFGLFIWRTARLYLAVRCGPVGQEGNGGHAHNDQLAIELQVDGIDWICDPGTYLYTPDPQLRNRYRSVTAHFAPQVDPPREPASLQLATFTLPDTTRARCLHFDARSFRGMHLGYGAPVRREVEIYDTELVVRDFAAAPIRLQPFGQVGPDGQSRSSCILSPGYGIARAA